MKTQVYLIGSSVVFFSYNPVGPVVAFLRSVPSALLTIDNAPSAGYVAFSQIDSTAGTPSPFITALFADIVDAVGANYVSITTLIAAITPAGGGGGGGTAPDIGSYVLGYDSIDDKYVGILTILDPVTNLPTRSFFELDGVTPYTPSASDNVQTPDKALPDISGNIVVLSSQIALITGQLGLTTAVGGNQTLLAKIRAAGTFTIPAGARKIKIISTAVSFIAGGVTYPITTTNGDKIDFYEAEATVGRRLTELVYAVAAGGSAIELVMN